MNIEIEKISSHLQVRAQVCVVVDQCSANEASQIISAGKSAIRKIEGFYEPKKAQARVPWQALVDEEKNLIAQIRSYIDPIAKSLAEWQVAEERKRREAEEKRYRAEQERIRLEAEALRKAQEAERKAKEAAERAVHEQDEAARKKAQEEAAKAQAQADRIIEKAAAQETSMAPLPIVPEAPKTKGLAMRDNWKFEIVDINQVPREYMIPDEIAIGKIVRATKGRVLIPGVRIYNDPSMASIGNRLGSRARIS